jgi:hypothetical protein
MILIFILRHFITKIAVFYEQFSVFILQKSEKSVLYDNENCCSGSVTGFSSKKKVSYHIVLHVFVYIQGVTGGTDQTSGGCSLC